MWWLQVEDGLVPLIAKLREGAAPDTSVIAGEFDAAVQSEVCNDIVKQLGFELNRGRLDVSVHPFTGGTCFILSLTTSGLAVIISPVVERCYRAVRLVGYTIVCHIDMDFSRLQWHAVQCICDCIQVKAAWGYQHALCNAHRCRASVNAVNSARMDAWPCSREAAWLTH